MNRRFYDSTNANDLPAHARNALAYLDGAFANVAAVKARIGGKGRVAVVTVLGSLDAAICDCERGDLTPESAARWAYNKRKAKKGFPTIYCIDSQRRAVIKACAKLGLAPRVHYNLFVANYDGKPSIPLYAVGKQYANSTLTGGHYDVSLVRSHWRGVDPPLRKPKPAPKPKPTPAPAPKPAPKPVPTPAPAPKPAPKPVPVPVPVTPTRGEDVKKITGLLNRAVQWVKTHPKQVKQDTAILAAALAAQPAIHALLHGQKVTSAALVAAVIAAASAAARRLIG